MGTYVGNVEAYVSRLPVLRLTLQEFERLLEYSCSYPTGTTPGKRWKRLDGSYDPIFIRNGGKPHWIIGEYDPADDGKGKNIKINWYRPVVTIRARAAIKESGK